MKRTFALTFCVLLVAVSFGQENKNNFKLAFGHHFSDQWIAFTEAVLLKNTLSLEWNRMIVPNLELGLYVGLRGYEVDFATLPDGSLSEYPTGGEYNLSALYGLNVNYHFLPLLVEQPTRWDVYLLGKAGASTADKTRFEYHLGIGAGYRLARRWGIFAEADFGNSFFSNYLGKDNGGHFHLRGGISFGF